MKKIIFCIFCFALYSSVVSAEEIDPLLLNNMLGGIACESYLDGKFNKTISSVYFDIANKKIHQISIQAWLPVSPDEPATIAFQTFNIKEINILEPKRISFTGTTDMGYEFNADISSVNPDKIVFNLKVSGRGVVEIKNIGRQGLELKKKIAPGIYLGVTNPQ